MGKRFEERKRYCSVIQKLPFNTLALAKVGTWGDIRKGGLDKIVLIATTCSLALGALVLKVGSLRGSMTFRGKELLGKFFVEFYRSASHRPRPTVHILILHLVRIIVSIVLHGIGFKKLLINLLNWIFHL